MRHDVNGKASNVYETAGDPRSFFPQFKEKMVDEYEKTQTTQNLIRNAIMKVLESKNISEEVDVPREVVQKSAMNNSIVSQNSSQIHSETKEPNQIIRKYLNVVNVPKCSNKKGTESRLLMIVVFR